MGARTRIGLLAVVLAAGCACVGGWVEESSPTGENLYSVYGVGDGTVFAVGAAGTVLMRDGGRWRALDSGVAEDLHGVWASSAEKMVAVGANCTALEFNGIPEKPEDGGEAPPDLKILEVDTCGTFRAIHGFADNRAFVVSDDRALWYNGSRLTGGREFNQRVLGVCMTGDDEIHVSGEHGFYSHKTGGNWNDRTINMCPVAMQGDECPTDLMQPVLWDTWAAPGGQGAVVGTYGGIWTLPLGEGDIQPELEAGFATELRGAYGVFDPEAAKNPVTIYAVGQYGVVTRIRGDKIAREAPGTNKDLHDVWVSDNGKHIYAVGEGGTIVHFSE